MTTRRPPSAIDLEADECLGVSDVARFFRVDASTVSVWIKNGELPSFVIGGTRRMLRSDLTRVIAERKERSR